MRGRGPLEWACNVACALVCGRAVAARVNGRVKPRGRLRRSIGVGGTASTVVWNLGYDPIVRATQGPAYVDDFSGLTVG
eukprot:4450830-Lingulodinium_polyedra.AAC.1